MPDETVVSVRYRSLRSADSFFENGRPVVNLSRSRLYLSRNFDLLLILGLIISFVLLIYHVLYVIIHAPLLPEPSSVVIGQCCIYEGEWNKDKSVLHYWSIPYAAPPILESNQKFKHVLQDLREKRELQDGNLRWLPPFSVGDDEYCFLSFDDRCTFEDGRWICKMSKRNTTRLCVEMKDDNTLIRRSDENCLNLDISMPPFQGSLLPVIVVFSSFRLVRNPIDHQVSEEPAYLPTDDTVVSSNAIWVNARFRLGPLGFFYDLNEMGRKSINISAKSFALLDQKAVLNWVQHNIGRFGGDVKKVTLLAHGSSATTALELVKLQSNLQNSFGWFRGAWLASGGVHWYDRKSNITYQNFLPSIFANKFTPKCANISDVECFKTLRERIITLELTNLTKQLKEFYDDRNALKKSLQLFHDNNRRSDIWFSTQSGTPIEWNKSDTESIFIQKEESTNHALTSLVFSSMMNELDGFDIERRFAGKKQVDEDFQNELYKITNNSKFLSEVSLLESSHNSNERTLGDLTLIVLSALKYTCPQAWLINKWLNQTISEMEEKTTFYHIYNTEAVRISPPKVPGPYHSLPRRDAFHGLDMLLLTSNIKSDSSMQSYRNNLRKHFHQFVHNGRLNNQCKVNNPQGTVVAQVGCEINRSGIKKIESGTLIDYICKSVKWNEVFERIAMAD